jgi:hypothetical protein
MIACFQEMYRISRFFGADFDGVVDFLEDTHRVRLDRPIMFPSVISGHCVIPNTEMLLKSYDSELLRLILKSNDKRKEEVKDESIRSEVEKVRKKWKPWRRNTRALLRSHKSRWSEPDTLATIEDEGLHT